MSTALGAFVRNIAPYVVGCPSYQIEQAIIDAVIQFYKDTGISRLDFEHEVDSADVDTTDNNSVTIAYTTYAGASLVANQVTGFRIDGGKRTIRYADPQNDQTYFDNLRTENEILYNFPSNTEVDFFGLDAVDQALWIEMEFYPVSTITTVDDVFFARHHLAIEEAVKAALLDIPGTKWHNPLLAEKCQGKYQRHMGNARAMAEKGRIKGSSRVSNLRLF